MIFSFKTEQEVDQFLKNLNSLFSLELTKSNLINDFSDESLSITNFTVFFQFADSLYSKSETFSYF